MQSTYGSQKTTNDLNPILMQRIKFSFKNSNLILTSWVWQYRQCLPSLEKILKSSLKPC